MATNQKKTAPKDEDQATLTPAAEPEQTAETTEPAAEPEQGVQAGPAHYRVISRFGLNLRDQAGMSGKIVKILPYGTEVVAAGEPVRVDVDVWLPVEAGWVNMTFLNPLATGE